MNKTLKVVMQIALIAIVCVACTASAASFFDTIIDRLGALFKSVLEVVFVLGAFALVGFAIMAIFGKLQWTKVAILAIGLALLAVASQVIDYATEKDSNSTDLETDRSYKDVLE